MQKNNSLISVVIVNYNGKKWLKKCLESLYNQTYKHFEIIFVDNNSTDDSIEFIKKHYSKVIIINNNTNLGFAKANNIGVSKAKGEYILLLNNDTYVDKDSLISLVEAFNELPLLGSVQPKLVLMDKTTNLDMCGAYWTDSSFLYHYGYGKDKDLQIYNKAMPFFSNKGACMLIRRDLIDKIGLFDDGFWSYYEETDFCHRIWMLGYECWYYPKSVVYHANGGTFINVDNSYIQFHNFKNKLMSFIKNFEIRSLVVIIPTYLFLNIVLSFFWLFQGKLKHFYALYKAIGWNIINLKHNIEKRENIQKIRKKTDSEIFKFTKKNPRLNYYLHLLKGDLENYAD